uniref:Uncharacterized protein n=1 Tax=Anguilla anguilla TaxID=7936 RepID=A0A0E9Q3V9_ANGAN
MVLCPSHFQSCFAPEFHMKESLTEKSGVVFFPLPPR